MTHARWLVDNSALARLNQREVESLLIPRIAGGLVGVSIMTELEVGFSARSVDAYRTTRETIMDQLVAILLPPRAESRARDVQARLVERGQHRGVSVPDLLIAATAESEGLTVLHYDGDFDLIAEVTGQRTEWVAPRGSID